MRKFIPLVFIAVLAFGCSDALQQGSDATPRDVEDRAPASAKNDSFLDGSGGKGDNMYDIQEGSSEAEALLDFVNSASLETLDDDVSLDVRAAENIVQARSDGDIESLQELDDIAWVSSRAFRKLYTYCQDNGIIGDGGSTDAPQGVEPDSARALGAFEVANTESASVLDDEVGLDARAATNIVEHRRGNKIESLKELKSISWVGDAAVATLADYAEANDLLPKVVHGIAVGSRGETGVLEVVNQVSESTLDSDVGLDTRAATNIVEYRQGIDMEAGTDDDEYYNSLSELAEISWVGERAFGKLLDYAKANGHVPVAHWRDLFSGDDVDVSFEVTSSTCKTLSCTHGLGGLNCSTAGPYEDSGYFDQNSYSEFRITGDTEGDLVAHFQSNEHEKDDWSSIVGGGGKFTLGQPRDNDHYSGNDVIDKRGIEADLNRDGVHTGRYTDHWEDGVSDEEERVDCTFTFERKSK